MNTRFRKIAVVLAVLFVAAQFVRPGRASPSTDPSRTIEAVLGPSSPLPGVLDRACGDCHSNRSVSAWYTKVAPLSWVMARAVADGRKVVNFSEWADYPSEVRRTLLTASCDAATNARMPGPYTLFRPEAKLSLQDVATICETTRPR